MQGLPREFPSDPIVGISKQLDKIIKTTYRVFGLGVSYT